MPRKPLVLLCLLLAGPARAATGGLPVAITHTGYLLDAGDSPVTGTLSLTFRVLDGSTGGTLQWEGSCPAAQVQRGYYTVVLGGADCAGTGGAGDTVLDTSDLPAGGARWLETQVGATVLSPRIALSAVPNAAVASRALDADRLGGLAPTAFAPAAHTHAASAITDFAAAAIAATASSYATTSHTHATASATATGLLSSTDWARFDAKVGAEVDPKIGTLTANKWCMSNGTRIDCNTDAPSGTASTIANQTTLQAPACDAAHKGYMYFDTTMNRFLGCNGLIYRSMDGSTSGDIVNTTFAFASDTTTWGNSLYAADRYNLTGTGDAASHCVQSDGNNNHWFRIDFGSPRAVTSFGVAGYPGGSHRPTGTWFLQGSNDAVAWTQLWTGDGSLWTADTLGSYPPRNINTVTSPGLYRYYRVTATTWTNGYMIVCNLAMYE